MRKSWGWGLVARLLFSRTWAQYTAANAATCCEIVSDGSEDSLTANVFGAARRTL
jgi:hypothetical protein